MSNSRKQIEQWLSTLEILGSVIDVGGLFWPVKGRTRVWDVSNYKILDIKKSRKGVTADFVVDLNHPHPEINEQFDNAFLIEVTDHLWNPVAAFENINRLLRQGGKLYISSNFIFPHHTGFDCIRLTETGLRKILKETGFEVIDMRARLSSNELLPKALDLESLVQYHRREIGYMCVAKKI